MIEDDDNDAVLIQRAFQLSDSPADIQFASDGEAALNYLNHTAPFEDRQKYPTPELILLDLKLRRKSGFEVLARIRDEHQLRRIPIVILTSSDVPTDIERAYELGANSYIVKPVGFTSLVKVVEGLSYYWFEMSVIPGG